MALSMLVGLGPGPIVLDGEWGPSYPPPPQKNGTESPILGPFLGDRLYELSSS